MNSKIQRLRKQESSLKTRGKEMLRRGLSSLDELDAIEEKECAQREAEEQLRRCNAAESFSLSEDQLALLAEYDDGQFQEPVVALDAFDGMLPPTQDNSSSQ